MKKVLLLCAVLAALAGCSVGPDYKRPDTTIPPGYKEAEGWREALPRDSEIRSNWWEIFNDPVLNLLAEKVAVENQSIALAEAQYRQAAAQVQLARAGYFPAAGAGATYTRARSSSTGYDILNTHNIALSASWEVDIWGKVRRQVEAGKASAEASFADLQAMKLSLQTQLVLNYYQLRMLDEQKKNLDQAILAYAKALELTQNRYKAGVAAKADVVQAETQLKTTQAQAVDLGADRALYEHAIAILIGRPPALFSLLPAAFQWPTIAIPVSLPSDLLERRPDIASAERKMAAANAQIGVAKAAFYPTVTLSGSVGYQGVELANLMTSPHFFWAVGPMALAATLFEGGARIAKTRQARAAYDGAVASYRQTVLAAFQDVEDQLAVLRVLAEEAGIQEQAVKAARESVALTTNQYKAGIVSYLNVVTAQTMALNNERTAISINGQRLKAAALLVKALGGGWTADPPGSKPEKGAKTTAEGNKQ
ncbi:MAG: efflux transporter outer membrane subunit [Syntrophaceae bacterium]|nr:efflux transporter outer membrane subunit [Syntrophaceae bacterium]